MPAPFTALAASEAMAVTTTDGGCVRTRPETGLVMATAGGNGAGFVVNTKSSITIALKVVSPDPSDANSTFAMPGPRALLKEYRCAATFTVFVISFSAASAT